MKKIDVRHIGMGLIVSDLFLIKKSKMLLYACGPQFV